MGPPGAARGEEQPVRDKSSPASEPSSYSPIAMSTQIWDEDGESLLFLVDSPPIAGSIREDSELAARTELAHAALRIWLLHMRQMRAPYERNMAKTRYWLQYRLMRRSDRPWNIFYLPGGVCPWDSDDPNSRVAHYPPYWLLLAWANDADYGPVPNRIRKGPGF